MEYGFSDVMTLTIGIIVVLIIASTLLTAFIASVVSLFKNGDKSKFIYVAISVLCVVVMAASWFLNFGWIRFILTLYMIPLIHAAVFVSTSNFSAAHVNQSKRLKIYTILYYVTYVLGYVTLSDAGDDGPMYVFFGLIRNSIIVDLSYYVSFLFFLAHTALFVLQIVEVIIAKRRIAKSKKATSTPLV
ncbi:MAG: hypothetical protein IKY12_01405 [Clostridia bacterium]|nr:hypothetical protein [Clostridia bacterium]